MEVGKRSKFPTTLRGPMQNASTLSSCQLEKYVKHSLQKARSHEGVIAARIGGNCKRSRIRDLSFHQENLETIQQDLHLSKSSLQDTREQIIWYLYQVRAHQEALLIEKQTAEVEGSRSTEELIKLKGQKTQYRSQIGQIRNSQAYL